MKKICSFIQNEILNGYLADNINFDDNFLRRLHDYYEMHGFDIEPIQGNNTPIDRISGKGKTDITGTDFYDSYFDEPLKLVKIAFEGEKRRELKISFNSKGVIRIYNKTLESKQLIKILKFITDFINHPRRMKKRERKVQTKINKFAEFSHVS